MLIKAPSDTSVRVALTTGRVFILAPNQERELTGDALQVALERGCQPVAPQQEEVPPAPPEESREARVEAAIRELMARGDETAFTSSGTPRVREVAVILGDEVTKGEIDEVFAAMSD